jgi:hypothetical protein
MLLAHSFHAEAQAIGVVSRGSGDQINKAKVKIIEIGWRQKVSRTQGRKPITKTFASTRIPQSKGKQRARRKFSVAKAMGLYLLESCKRRCDEWLPEMLRTECRVRKMALEHYASLPSQLQTYASPSAGVPLTAESGFTRYTMETGKVLPIALRRSMAPV